MKATPEELAKYMARSRDYEHLAYMLEKLTEGRLLDKQALSVAGQWAVEARDLAARWSSEKQGGL